jgi:hypothetical protein
LLLLLLLLLPVVQPRLLGATESVAATQIVVHAIASATVAALQIQAQRFRRCTRRSRIYHLFFVAGGRPPLHYVGIVVTKFAGKVWGSHLDVIFAGGAVRVIVPIVVAPIVIVIVVIGPIVIVVPPTPFFVVCLARGAVKSCMYICMYVCMYVRMYGCVSSNIKIAKEGNGYKINKTGQ